MEHQNLFWVRQATRVDASTISALTQSVQELHAVALPARFKAAGPETFPTATAYALLERPETVMLVAGADDDIVAYAYAEMQHFAESAFRSASARLLVHQLIVRAHNRRQGIGRALLATLRVIAAEMGASTLALDVWDFNRDARAFYATAGFLDVRHVMESALVQSANGSARAEV